MRKSIIVLLCAVMLCCITAYAVETRSDLSGLELTFDGTTAICTCRFSSLGDTIAVTMNLWNGDTFYSGHSVNDECLQGVDLFSESNT